MIYLLRHGEIGSTGDRRFIGWTDVPLNENGLRQAESWRMEFAGTPFDRILCSDLDRTRTTARIIARDREIGVQEVPDLREIHLGELEALPFSEVQERLPKTWRERGRDLFAFRPAGGESFADLQQRVLPAFENIAGEAVGNILIVAHGGVNRIILCHLLGMPPENLFRIGQDYACLNRIDVGKTPRCIMSLNQCLESNVQGPC
jgi:probable phosphoglycerate mutase